MPPVEAECEYDYAVPIPLRLPGAATPPRQGEQLQTSREAQASVAIAELVRAHGLTTTGDLMVALGVESIPHLLAMLGFTDDLAGLAREVATTDR